IDIDDPEYSGIGERIGTTDYETLLQSGDPQFAWQPPSDEWNAIALNYTSGTTGNPKGVVYHHGGERRNQRVPAPGRPSDHFRTDQDSRRDPLLRCAHCAQRAGQRACAFA